MKNQQIAILAACTFFAGGCNKSPTSPTTNGSDSQPPPPIQAEAFQGQVYKSLNGRTVLTLVSKDECELAEGGTTLLCKYTKPNNTLRIVTTALGTSQVIYFRLTDQGLEDNNGNVLLSPERYTAAIEQLQRQQQEQARQQLEKQQAEERKQLEEKRVAEMMANAKRETQTIASFTLAPVTVADDYHGGGSKVRKKGSVILTDASLKLQEVDTVEYYGVTQNRNVDVYFSQVRKIGDVGEAATPYGFVVECGDRTKLYTDDIPAIIPFNSEAEARTAHDAVLNAFDAWKKKFPEAVLR